MPCAADRAVLATEYGRRHIAVVAKSFRRVCKKRRRQFKQEAPQEAEAYACRYEKELAARGERVAVGSAYILGEDMGGNVPLHFGFW